MKIASHLCRFALAGALVFAAVPAMAQVTGGPDGAQAKPMTGFWLTTPYPDFTLSAGNTGDIDLTLKNQGLPPQRAQLQLTGLPAGWKATLKGGGHPITAVIVGENDTQDVTLDVTPPSGVTSGTYKFAVEASYGAKTLSLPLALTLSAKKAGGITLTPQLPALRGSPTTSFKYQVKIANNSDKKALFDLSADVPAGFQTSFTHGYGSTQITGLPIAAGANDTVTLDVKPNPSASAGKYPITMKVQAGKLMASSELGLQITGAPTLDLTGPGERLSGQAVAGQSTTFPFTLQNSGSAPAQDVKLSANAPTDWNVTFDPATIAALAAGASQKVNVKIEPSEKAIAGDYMVGVNANGQGVTEAANFRVTVNTSTIWGIVGLIVIAIAVIILVLAVLRYGRR